MNDNLKNKHISIMRYSQTRDEAKVLHIIDNEDEWEYATEKYVDRYKLALENSITYVAYKDGELCGYSRSNDDFGICVFVHDLLVSPAYRRHGIGRMLMECIHNDYPDREVYVMSDVDGYYSKLGYEKAGSIFTVPKPEA